MARYLQTAARYSNLPAELMALVPVENHEKAAELIARLVNAGMVGNPRPPQSTVRINYVRAVCKDLPIICDLEERDKDYGDGTYKALVVRKAA